MSIADRGSAASGCAIPVVQTHLQQCFACFENSLESLRHPLAALHLCLSLKLCCYALPCDVREYLFVLARPAEAKVRSVPACSETDTSFKECPESAERTWGPFCIRSLKCTCAAHLGRYKRRSTSRLDGFWKPDTARVQCRSMVCVRVTAAS